ncbi:hypothetical protein F4782DRAFT_529301 [Xylaria castorea]|nr:hypothetical protein F4782DRAFT_529301 [Xylaria castorea]
MAEIQQTEGIMEAPKRDAPAQSEVTRTPDQKVEHELNSDGPAPPTSLPPDMIQEENRKHLSVLPAANVPQVVVEGNPSMVTPLERLTAMNAWIDCPFCQHTTKTRMTKEGDSQQTKHPVLPINTDTSRLKSPMKAHKPPFYASCAQTSQDTSQDSLERPPASRDAQNHVRPQPLDSSWLGRVLHLAFDLAIAAIALLFAVFAFWVRKIDGTPADPGSIGLKLYEAPTLYPLLFAAIVGGSLKSIASWKIQTRRGAPVGEVEQCMGSQTISRAFATQIKLRALNLLGIFIVGLWSLSPVGSQASLRVISVGADLTSSQTPLKSPNTFTEYQFGNAEGISEAVTTIAGPVIASLLAGSLLGTRNQDLWGNIRLPGIEQIENNQTNGWMTLPEPDNLTYSSLVGIPVSIVAGAGNTSFTLPGSYLALSCPTLGPSKQDDYTNFTNSEAPSPGNKNDSFWFSSMGGGQYQMAISAPSSALDKVSMNTETRDARKFVWESFMEDNTYFRAECDLTTTYVDSNVTCSRASPGGSSGGSSGSVCGVSSARRSVTATIDGNWTVFDIDFPEDADSVLQLITGLFPYAQLSGGVQPVLGYVVNPYAPFSSDPDLILDTDRPTFEIRLAQIFNTVLYLGISPTAFTGAFNASDPLQQANAINMTGMTVVSHEVVRCNSAWFAVLVVASFVLFLCALAGAILRLVTITPDVLGSISVALLHNKTQGVVGSSTWSSSRWGREAKDTRLCLADVNPGGDVGCIALASSTAEGVLISRVAEKGRQYL